MNGLELSGSRAAAEAFLRSPLARFRPWVTPDGVSPQREFLRAAATHPNRIFRAGNRAGKTTVHVFDVLLRAEGWHPFDRHRGPTLTWFTVLDWETGVGQIVWPAMKPWIDRSRVKIAWQRQSGIEIPQALKFPNGSEIHFKSAEAGRTKFQGVKLNHLAIDEEMDQVIVEEGRARLLDTGGTFSVTLTPVSRKAWVRDLEREVDPATHQPLTKVVRASMLDAARAGILNEQAVQRYLSTLPERQRRVRELGDYASIEGLVYPDFSRETHCLSPRGDFLIDAAGRPVYPWPLPETWPRFAAMDFGYANPSAVVLAAEDPFTGRLVVERVYYGKELTAHRWAGYLRQNLPPLEAPLVADWDALARAELADNDIPTNAAVKDVVPGIEAVDRWLYPAADGKPRLLMVLHDETLGALPAPQCTLTGTRADAHFLAWELEGYRYAERKEGKPNPKDEPVKRDDHACFVGETVIETSQGPLTIYEMLASRQVAFEVPALDPTTGAWVHEVAVPFPTSEDAALVEVAWDGGSVRCTPDHPFLTTSGWRNAADLAGMSVLRGIPYPEERERGPDGGYGEPLGQPPGEPGVQARPRPPLGAHDAGETSGGSGAGRPAGRPGGQGVACDPRGASVALEERQDGVGRSQADQAHVQDVRDALREPAPGREVLHLNVQGGRPAGATGRQTPVEADPEGLRGGDVRDADAKGALHLLARERHGELPVAPTLVRSVRPAGRGPVYGLRVRRVRNYVANGCVVANCDALRYLCAFMERRGGGNAPHLPAVEPKPKITEGMCPPSPWNK